MRWAIRTADIGGKRYVVGCRLVDEFGHAQGDLESERAITVFRDDGSLRWVLADNPHRGELLEDGTIDQRSYTLVEAPEPAAAARPDPRRAAVASALPDILLAVADGADLALEVKRVISAAEQARRGDGQR